ncbi:MAG TPA: hypothetical protein VJ840_16165 [Gemmatimonadaceae bacterium]|nr:hypothetical protein [Gemmatimonadaceae bacterium]
MTTLTAAIDLLQLPARRGAGSSVLQLIKAFIGLAMIIVLPTVMIYWARKRFRP